MKKRILSILLTMLLMITLVGCNQETDSPSKNHSNKVEEDDDKETNAKDEEELTVEEKLLTGNWYLNLFELSCGFFKIEFNEDGSVLGTYLPKETDIEISIDGEWEYNAKKKELSYVIPSFSDFEGKFYYDEDKNRFQTDFELEDFFDESEIPEEILEETSWIWEDGINIYVFSSEHNYENIDEEIFNDWLLMVYGEGDYSEYYEWANTLEINVEKTRKQKDKSAIAELHHAIEITMAYIDEEVNVNPNPVKVNKNGEIVIVDLFDTSNIAGRSFVSELEYTLGDTIALSSRMKNDCTIQIVKFNAYSGTVVIQVISEETDEEFYIDPSGEWEGIYIVEDEPDFSQRPTLDDYGYGEIKIWVAENMVDITEQYAEQFLESDWAYHGYSVVVEPIGLGDAPSNMINNPEYGADIYGFAQDQLARLVVNNVLYDLNDTYYSDYIIQNNDAGAVKAATYGGGMYGFPITSDNGYFMYYDKSVITDPSSLETIISDCERAGKNIYFEVNNGWYQTAFFFATGCVLNYDVGYDGTLINCNINYDSDAGLVALKEIIDLTSSTAFRNGSYVWNADNAAVVISGTWDRQNAMDLFGDNYAATKLPEFVGCDGKEYQLSGFCGNKLLGVKPQTNQGKAIVCLNLAEYLSSVDVQEARYDYMGWEPSNLYAQQSYSVQADVASSALLDQNQYARPQGQYPGKYWERATTLGDEIIAGYYNNSSDSELRNVLAQFEADCESYADN